MKCTGEVVFTNTLPINISVDWGTGTGSDDTAITIGQYNQNKFLISKQMYFNDKRANETTDYILTLIKQFVKEGF
jgi:hypothetical protein